MNYHYLMVEVDRQQLKITMNRLELTGRQGRVDPAGFGEDCRSGGSRCEGGWEVEAAEEARPSDAGIRRG